MSSEPTVVKYFQSIYEQLYSINLTVEITFDKFIVRKGKQKLFTCQTIDGLAGFYEGYKKSIEVND